MSKEIAIAMPDESINNQISTMIEGIQMLMNGINSQNEQMGILNKTVGHLKSDLVEVKGDVKDISERVRVIEEDEALKPYQQYNVSQAVRIRVSSLLKIEFDEHGGVTDESMDAYNRYYSKFCGRLHNDAKHAGIEASNWRFTPRKSYQQLIEFISEWIPSRGVDGLKNYFDKLEASRKKNAA